ncbi:site-specific DNA-methyltransferase [Sphingobium sp. AP49]|uniref:site-specific DNA-methyltransferase n=1 Tax=Sphingobium sp. AP49 TaxID=1144307 RepID=UPI00026ECF7C|nr:site-specific DNA-methyltransferase [Sphingobium sp. AP49]WHO38738.1 site-specific DNA-methyltransferase [Sphingobium sp. AP49]
MASGNGTVDRLYYGDNLDILRAHITDESVDLVYLDPPFNSNASYNILFRSPAGTGADASIEAFDDTWSWGPAAAGALMDITNSGNHRLYVLMQAMRTAIGENAMMAYLVMMAVRLQELHRVLKSSGSLYLHCDPTASHYLKLVLDAVFGVENFRSEIIWRRTSSHNKLSTQFGPVHDTIFFYSRSRDIIFHPGRTPHLRKYISGAFRYSDDRGAYRLNELTGAGIRAGASGLPWMGYDPTARSRHWAIPASLKALLPLDQQDAPPQQMLDLLHQAGEVVLSASGRPTYKQRLGQGTVYQDIWAYQPGTDGCLIDTEEGIDADVKWLDSEDEKLGYPTQKPIGLLERIIAASSNPGDVILDPFCGCGTAVDAAQKLGRRWIGIDITHLAIGLIEKRLREGYGNAARFETIGSPRDLASAQRLAVDDPHQFQHWITLKLGGWPWMGGKKGGDKGVDGYFYYVGEGGQTRTGVISVKAGHNVNPAMVRDLGRVMQRDGHRIGLFVCAAAPTRGMEQEADSHGLVQTEFGRFPALQIFTLAELFVDRHPRLPPLVSPNRKAPRIETRVSHQPGAQAGLDFGDL